MKSMWLISAVLTGLFFLASSPVPAQGHSRDRNERELHTKFDNRDRQAARKWYERARSLGAAGAEERLRRIGAP